MGGFLCRLFGHDWYYHNPVSKDELWRCCRRCWIWEKTEDSGSWDQEWVPAVRPERKPVALNVVCDKGHSYIQPDIVRGLKHGEPICPECREEWLLEQWKELSDGEEGRTMVEVTPCCVQKLHKLLVRAADSWTHYGMSGVLARIEEFGKVTVGPAGTEYAVEIESSQSIECVAELVKGTLEYEEKKARSVPNRSV